MTDTDRQHDRFDEAFRRWARREPTTSATEAARRVAARSSSSRAPTRLSVWTQRLAVACGLTLVAASGVLLWRSQTPAPMPSPANEAPPVLPDNVVIFWLDAETPVYFVVSPLEDLAGGTP